MLSTIQDNNKIHFMLLDWDHVWLLYVIVLYAIVILKYDKIYKN